MFNNKNMFVALTYKCNAFCKKCMTRYHINRNAEMDRETFQRLFFLAREHNYRGMFSVGTGEPLLYEKLPVFVEQALSVNSDISLRILTNGMELTCDKPSIIYDKRCKWGVTMDSFYGKNLISVQKGVDVDVVKYNIENFVKEYGAERLYLNFTVYRNNIDDIIPFCYFAIANGIKEIYLTELKVFSGYESTLMSHVPLRNDKYLAIIDLAKNILIKNNISTKGIDVFQKRDRHKCYKNRIASPMIDVTGDVSFCSGKEDCIIGNIHDNNIVEKWREIYAVAAFNNSWCSSCFDKQLDDGTYRLPKTIRRKTND